TASTKTGARSRHSHDTPTSRGLLSESCQSKRCSRLRLSKYREFEGGKESSEGGMVMTNLYRRSVTGVLAALAIIAGGVAASAQDKVGVITDAGFLGRHAYYFVAIEKGFYKEAKLDVNVLRGQGSAEAIKQVGAGNVTFGFADA